MEKDPLFNQSAHPAVDDLERIVFTIFGADNRIFQYQNYFRKLINDGVKEPINDAISFYYIQQMIDHIKKNSRVIRNENLPVIQRETIEYCLWKLQNIKFSAVAMVRDFKQQGLVRRAN
ncbi:hypothetical protein [Pelosinus propionicus]|uniref:hypothetical protein n=1 Tax=Pelosinus propionicus TaxID=380084 RepID=UPI001FE1D561|nr:hypothetical protein [Pelosinus propionicus]